MTTPDYPKALAAARKRVQIINSFRPELLDDNEIAIRDLVAALDAARGEAVWQFRMACFPNSWTDISYENVDQWKAGGFDVRCLFAAPPAASDVHSAWYEGYRAGVLDERTSEASIGIAGFGAKIEPARVNPYAAPPAAPRVERYGEGVLVHWPEGVEQYVAVGDCVTAPPAAAVPAANVTPMRQPRADLARLVESINAAVYANGDGLSVTEAIGALELAKLELLKEQEQ